MAFIILQQLNAPALVSSVELDVAANQSAKLPNAAQCAEIVAQITAACQPKPHHFVIKPAGE